MSPPRKSYELNLTPFILAIILGLWAGWGWALLFLAVCIVTTAVLG